MDQGEMYGIAILIAGALQAVSCVALVVASMRARRQVPLAGVRAALFPYVVAAGAFGLLNVYPMAAELFVAHYSGAIYEMAAGSPVEAKGVGGIPMIVLLRGGFSAFALLLPLAGLVPAFGRRALLMAVLGTLAMLPWLINLLGHLRAGEI